MDQSIVEMFKITFKFQSECFEKRVYKTRTIKLEKSVYNYYLNVAPDFDVL